MPILHLSDDQLDQVFRAARPLPVRDHDAFLQAVADGLRGRTISDGEVFRASVKRSASSTMRRRSDRGAAHQAPRRESR
jgi:hypothetical protein